MVSDDCVVFHDVCGGLLVCTDCNQHGSGDRTLWGSGGWIYTHPRMPDCQNNHYLSVVAMVHLCGQNENESALSDEHDLRNHLIHQFHNFHVLNDACFLVVDGGYCLFDQSIVSLAVLSVTDILEYYDGLTVDGVDLDVKYADLMQHGDNALLQFLVARLQKNAFLKVSDFL